MAVASKVCDLFSPSRSSDVDKVHSIFLLSEDEIILSIPLAGSLSSDSSLCWHFDS